jgi:hypothetical protein
MTRPRRLCGLSLSREYVQIDTDDVRSVNIAHFLGGFSCEVAGNRAIAQTKMKIEQRAIVDGTEVDVTCSGRFYFP